MARLHPRRAKPVVALPLIILALAALALTPFCLMSFEKTYSGFSNKYASEQALKAYKENRFDEAATVLERLAVGHKLDDEQRLLLNNVYFSRADFRALHLDYNNAIADLANITPDFSKSRLVAQKKHDYLELLKEQAKAQLQAAQAKVKEANQLSSRSTQIALKSQSTVSTKVKAAVKENETTSPIKAVSKPVTVPENSEAQGEQKTDAQTANLPSQPVTVAKSSARSKYSENDVVRYNELLAGYFSQDRKSSSSPAEPPSLKEWIDLGKPSF